MRINWNRRWAPGLLALALLLTSACEVPTVDVDEQANAFFGLFNAENDEGLYAMTHSIWRNAYSRESGVAYFSDIRRDLGRYKERDNLVSIKNVAYAEGAGTAVKYTTRFDRGEGSVTLTFLKENDQPRLYYVRFEFPSLGVTR